MGTARDARLLDVEIDAAQPRHSRSRLGQEQFAADGGGVVAFHEALFHQAGDRQTEDGLRCINGVPPGQRAASARKICWMAGWLDGWMAGWVDGWMSSFQAVVAATSGPASRAPSGTGFSREGVRCNLRKNESAHTGLFPAKAGPTMIIAGRPQSSLTGETSGVAPQYRRRLQPFAMRRARKHGICPTGNGQVDLVGLVEEHRAPVKHRAFHQQRDEAENADDHHFGGRPGERRRRIVGTMGHQAPGMPEQQAGNQRHHHT
nr:hypothetical protein [Tanacetum cinerariifolium]